MPRALCDVTFVFMIILVLHSDRAFAQTVVAPQNDHFRADGPNADEFGRKEGYPSCKGLDYVNETRCRVAALSHYDALFPAYTIAAPRQAAKLGRAPIEPVIRYGFAGPSRALDVQVQCRLLAHCNRNPCAWPPTT